MDVDETNLKRLCIKRTEMEVYPAFEPRVAPFREWIWRGIGELFHRIKLNLSPTYRVKVREHNEALHAKMIEQGRLLAEEDQRDRELQANDPEFWRDPLVASVRRF